MTPPRSNRNQVEEPSKFYLIPIIFAIAIIPFIMRFTVTDSGLSKYDWFPASGQRIDFFNYYKSIAIIGVAVLMAFILLYHLFVKTKFKRSLKVLIPLLVYAVWVILSTFASVDIDRSLNGMFDHFENTYVIIGYLLIAAYSYLVIREAKDLKIIFGAICIAASIMFVIGIFQFTGHDLIQTTLMQRMIFPQEYWAEMVGQKLELSFGNMIYLTLFNPNYAGVYMAMLLPIVIILGCFTKDKKIRIGLVILSILMLFVLYGSSSSAAIIGFGVALLAGCIFLRGYLIRHWKWTLGVLLILIVAVLALDFASGHRVSNKIIAGFTSEPKAEEYPLEEIVTGKDNVKISYKGNDLYLSYEVQQDDTYKLFMLDSDKKDIVSTYDYETMKLSDERYSDLTIQLVKIEGLDGGALAVNISGQDWIFYAEEKDGYFLLNPFGKLEKMNEVETIGFVNSGEFASSRGFIWSRSLPLIKESMLVGKGPETFMIEYPQNDYVGKLRYLGLNSQLVDKPHNMYLQTWIQTGFVSLLAFLAFYLIYFIGCVRLYWKNKFISYEAQVGLAIFLGTLVFMVMGLANDSNVNVSPMFWCLMGLGYATNHLVKSKQV